MCGSVQKGSLGNQVQNSTAHRLLPVLPLEKSKCLPVSGSTLQRISTGYFWSMLPSQCLHSPPQNRYHAGLMPTGPVLTRLNFSVWGDTLPPPFVLNVIYQFWFYNLVVLSLCGIWRVETYFLPPHDFHWAFNWHGTPCVFTADPKNLLSSLLPHNLFL